MIGSNLQQSHYRKPKHDPESIASTMRREMRDRYCAVPVTRSGKKASRWVWTLSFFDSIKGLHAPREASDLVGWLGQQSVPCPVLMGSLSTTFCCTIRHRRFPRIERCQRMVGFGEIQSNSVPRTTRLSQSAVSSNDPRPSWPQRKFLSIASMTGVFMSSKKI